MKIAAMMRVKNEARWLEEVLASIQPLTKDILVFDDHSTDDTVPIARSMGCEVVHSPYEGLNESRDKNTLLAMVRAHYEPDYVLSIDGDEVLEAGAADRIRAKLDPATCLYQLHFRYIWNDRQHYRADGVYAKYVQWRLFSLVNQKGKLVFPSVPKRPDGRPNPNFHCGNTPLGLVGAGATLNVDVLHLGYMHAEDRIRKFHWYNHEDPDNRMEDCYRHMVIGDLPEFPAEMKRKHGGPLKLFTLPASKWPNFGQPCAMSKP